MKKNLIILVFNLLVLIAFLLIVPNLDCLKATTLGLLLIGLPWFLFFILSLTTKKTFHKVLTVSNIFATSLFLLVFFAIYRTHLDRRDMHFDKYKAHELQKEAEISVTNYIMENSMFPESYESLEFGNLEATEVSKQLNKEIDHTDIQKGIARSGNDYLDSLKSEAEFIKVEKYNFEHSYFLKNKDGRRLFRVAFIEFDSSLNVIRIFNQEDFSSISWKEYFGK
jgi:signal transduction histidine kinase